MHASALSYTSRQTNTQLHIYQNLKVHNKSTGAMNNPVICFRGLYQALIPDLFATSSTTKGSCFHNFCTWDYWDLYSSSIPWRVRDWYHHLRFVLKYHSSKSWETATCSIVSLGKFPTMFSLRYLCIDSGIPPLQVQEPSSKVTKYASLFPNDTDAIRLWSCNQERRFLNIVALNFASFTTRGKP